MKVFVTGATGFLGGEIVKALCNRGDEVVVLARSKTKKFDGFNSVNVVYGEVGRLGQNAVQFISGVDGIIHCAAHVTPFGEWSDFERVNVLGTKELLDAAVSCGVKSFVNFSTPSVYVSFSDRFRIKESDQLPEHQVSMYGKSKVMADRLIAEAAHGGLNVCSLRPRAVIGVGDRNILPRMIRIGRRGVFPLVRGGDALIDVTHIANVVSATINALDHPVVCRGEVFNITNGDPISLKDLAQNLFQEMNQEIYFFRVPWITAKVAAKLVEFLFRLFKPGVEPPISVYAVGLTSFTQTLDISKARKVLNYSPNASVQDGIREFVKWWGTLD